MIMNKGRIALIISLVLSAFCLLYAFLQKLEADANYSLAEARRMEAETLKIELEKTREMADMAQLEAKRQENLATQAMAECEKRLKK
jgi:hypothetical protein